MRQTEMSIGDLLTELKNPHPSLPHCFLVNELGEICVNGRPRKYSEDSITAEETLRSLLLYDDPVQRFMSYHCLSTKAHPGEMTIECLEKFRNDPQNADFLTRADEFIARWRQTHQ